MQVTAIKTHKITEKDTDIMAVLDKYLVENDKIILKENSVLAVTSKIIALCEGRVAEDADGTRDRLVEEEAEYYLPRHSSKYDFCISIKHNTFTATAGIDRSNANGKLVLWPKDLQKSANTIREHISNKFGIKNIGIVITDSKTSPLRWGVTGVALSHSGFAALKSYIGTPDIFGRPLHFEKTNVADSLATAAVVVMGEGNEQTPLAVVSDVPFVDFQDRNPTQEELDSLHIELEDDVFAPLLTSVEWKKGKGGK